jgi:hypothetical protein
MINVDHAGNFGLNGSFHGFSGYSISGTQVPMGLTL